MQKKYSLLTNTSEISRLGIEGFSIGYDNLNTLFLLKNDPERPIIVVLLFGFKFECWIDRFNKVKLIRQICSSSWADNLYTFRKVGGRWHFQNWYCYQKLFYHPIDGTVANLQLNLMRFHQHYGLACLSVECTNIKTAQHQLKFYLGREIDHNFVDFRTQIFAKKSGAYITHQNLEVLPLL